MSDPMNAPVMYEMTSEQYAEQIRAAEKRGAVKALRWLADDIKGERPTSATRDLASAIYADARRIESGEVTLP